MNSARAFTRWLALASAAALSASCLERRRDEDPSLTLEARCTQCHGDPARAGDYLARSAPPRDLRGATTTDSPGVGAHQLHLNASATHDAIACGECHHVPASVDEKGHADSARPAELSFGALASHGNKTPHYDPVARTCSDTWCHRDAQAIWSAPRDSGSACGSCHGLPPPSPHPQSERCSVCHGAVVDAERRIIAPALHVDGRVQYSAGPCNDCHGSLDNDAPPKDTMGHVDATALGVGAHQVHLQGGNGRALECTECHTVPEKVEDPTHADGLPAEVLLVGVAASKDHQPAWVRDEARCVDTWCHGLSSGVASPIWNQPSTLPCDGCHGLPPPAPHPVASQCWYCHSDVVGRDNRTIIDRTRHVDGHIDSDVGDDCRACHGATNPAPPPDTSGNTDTSWPGVGAHQTHLLGTPRSRPVACETCHSVPETVLAPGHLDGASPANVVFSGVATAFGAAPVYAEGKCESTACHGAIFPGDHDSGGSHTVPTWSRVDGSEAACGTCHGLPPPRPHPYKDQSPNCSGCHHDLAPDNVSFVRPDLHVDGVVTFELP